MSSEIKSIYVLNSEEHKIWPPSHDATLDSLKAQGIHPSRIIPVDISYLASRSWEKEAQAVIIPGGNAFYLGFEIVEAKAVMEKIRTYVAGGGNYLGLCCGAMLALEKPTYSSYDERLCNKRVQSGYLPYTFQLTKSPNKCPAYEEIIYEHRTAGHDTARAALVTDKESDYYLFWNWGPSFAEGESSILNYSDIPEHPAAITEFTLGTGRGILSGVHPEISASVIEEWATTKEWYQLLNTEENETHRVALLQNIFTRLGIAPQENTSPKEEPSL